MTGIGRKTGLVLAFQAAGIALGALSAPAIGRWFGDEALGMYAFAMGSVALVAVLAKLGFGKAHQRMVARGVPLERCLGVYMRIRAATIALFLLGLATLYLVWTRALGKSVTDATTPTVLAVAVAVQVLFLWRIVAIETWQGQLKVHRSESILLLDSLVSVGLIVLMGLGIAVTRGRWVPVPWLGEAVADAVGMVAPLGDGQAALYLAAAYLVGKATSMAAAWAMTVRDRIRIGPWDRELAKEYAAFALPMAVPAALGIILTNMDVLMLGFFWDASEVGLYAMGQKLAVLALTTGAVVAGILFPRYASLLSRGDREAAKRLFLRAERFLLLVAMPVSVSFMVLPEEILHIVVGDRFLPAAPALRWLGAWALVMTLGVPVRSKLMGDGRVWVAVRGSFLNAGLNLVLNLLLIPREGWLGFGFGLGAEGAAIATAVSSAAAVLYLRVAARRSYGTPVLDRVQARHAAAGVLVGAAWWYAVREAPAAFDRLWELAGWTLGGAFAYVLVLLAIRELTVADLRFLWRSVDPRGLWRELRGRE